MTLAIESGVMSAGTGAVRVEVLYVLAEHGFNVASSEDEHAIEALSPDGANESLDDGIRRRTGRAACRGG